MRHGAQWLARKETKPAAEFAQGQKVYTQGIVSATSKIYTQGIVSATTKNGMFSMLLFVYNYCLDYTAGSMSPTNIKGNGVVIFIE